MLRKIFGPAIALALAVSGGELLPSGSAEGTRFGEGGGLFAQDSAAGSETALPLRRIALFSSGVGYFEHSGTLFGPSVIVLNFDAAAVNDALKSLIIGDPAPDSSPLIRYPSEETLERTLESLGIDLSGNPGTAEIFAAQRGAEVQISAPNPLRGRIVGVESRNQPNPESPELQREAFLSLFTAEGIRLIALKDIVSFTFTDPGLTADLKRALDLIAAHRASRTRTLTLSLNGNGSRSASVSYVISVPVWKVSYRLDLGRPRPLFQGWAIVDNDSDTDWTNVELSLVSGRPVSFIQQLYPPYYYTRPTLPLSIAETAQARVHAPGYGRDDESSSFGAAMLAENAIADAGYNEAAENKLARARGPAPPAPSVAAVQAAASGYAAGDQFAFTVKNPVTLNRRQSAMIPLVNGSVEAVKTLILSGGRALGGTIHPELAVELINTTGVKLPPGPVTVFDGGTYAGDALIEFLSENDKRFISYGEDLSVNASAALAADRIVNTVTVNAGVMTITRRQIYKRTYTVKNNSAEARRLIIEHPLTSGASLTEPANPLEKTDSLYRFLQNLPPRGELTFTVQEESPVYERISLSQIRLESIVSFSTSQEIPARIRAALARMVELRQKTDAAKQALSDLQARHSRLIADQDRIRNNLGAVGNNSDLGREYMQRMTELDRGMDSLAQEIDKAAALVRSSQKELEDYIAGLKL
ncbi:MAG: DUF4139 domain-containing protein [Spirochaetaceae bacterium]|jgi:hypothetical protein|nr:DUF4139 domain-containing protein [Spirochaetaceae bacterium]